MFCVFRGNRRGSFSAVWTCWRRDWDSNLRYPFSQAAKTRCVRYIQRILQHTRPIRRMASKPECGKVVPFLMPPKGERLAIVGLKTQVLAPLPCPNGFAHDCAPTAQSEEESISADILVNPRGICHRRSPSSRLLRASLLSSCASNVIFAL